MASGCGSQSAQLKITPQGKKSTFCGCFGPKQVRDFLQSEEPGASFWKVKSIFSSFQLDLWITKPLLAPTVNQWPLDAFHNQPS
jgi:hypothetical protein